MFVISANFKVSSWDALAKLTAAVPELKEDLHSEDSPVSSHVIVSTCNRVEIYFESDDIDAAANHITAFVADRIDMPQEQAREQLYLANEIDAIEHLARTTCGLEALAVGETEVGGQVRRAYTGAIASGTVSPTLRRIFDDALRMNKEVRRRGDQPHGNLVAMALDQVPNLDSIKSVLIIGTGEFARIVHTQMHAMGIDEQWNYSTSDRRLAVGFDHKKVSKEELVDRIGKVGLVVSATGAEKPVITKEMIDQVRANGGTVPPLVDLSIGEDIAKDVDAQVLRLADLAHHPTTAEGDLLADYIRMRAETLAHKIDVSAAHE